MILILIYTSMIIIAEPRSSGAVDCAAEAKSRIGEQLKVTVWDDMNGSHPIPTVHTAFCVTGSTVVR